MRRISYREDMIFVWRWHSRNWFCTTSQKSTRASGAIRGVEALIRWNHPHLAVSSRPPGIHSPCGKNRIDSPDWRMDDPRGLPSDEGVARRWPHRHWTVAVNLSSVQFSHAGLIDVVCRNLKRYSLDPGCLVLEITESTAMRDPEMSLSILQKLHHLGVRHLN